jgi:uncharacterized membrane protein
MQEVFELAVLALETVAASLIVIGAAISLGRLFYRGLRGDVQPAYRAFRAELGRYVQITLEILIAAEIIKTVIVEQTFASLGMLALVVLIRTFVGVFLELEISGRWPWQKASGEE